MNTLNLQLPVRKLLKFTIPLDRDEDGRGIVECPAIPGGVSGSETKDEALENIKDAMGLGLQVRAEKGMRCEV